MIYATALKRALDLVLSTVAIIVLSPLLLLLTVVGLFAVKGNPFFTQDRPGLNEKIFKLIKFRTMTNDTDEKGIYLPDEIRLIPYGRFLRKTSLDELPELFNIWKGDMAIVGPRPLLAKYLPFYRKMSVKDIPFVPGLPDWLK